MEADEPIAQIETDKVLNWSFFLFFLLLLMLYQLYLYFGVLNRLRSMLLAPFPELLRR